MDSKLSDLFTVNKPVRREPAQKPQSSLIRSVFTLYTENINLMFFVCITVELPLLKFT